MMPGYHLLFREHGRRIIDKEAAVPDVALGIGAAENLRPQQQPVVFGIKQREPKIQQTYLVDALQYVGEGKLITPEDFPQEGYRGKAIYDY